MKNVTPDMMIKAAETIRRLGAEGYSVSFSSLCSDEPVAAVQMTTSAFKEAFEGCEIESSEQSRDYDRYSIVMDDVEFYTLVERPKASKTQRVRL